MRKVKAPTQLPGPEPTEPELSPIRVIHRYYDPHALVTFHRISPEDKFENLFAISLDHLDGMFPEFKEQLERDSFFSINAFWSPEHGRQYHSALRARQPNRLRYLTAVFCDLDTYKIGLSFGEAVGKVLAYQDDDKIPPPSIITRSGRGLWLFWLLRDPKIPEMPSTAHGSRLRLYLEILRAAGERFAELGADAGARDALRLTRVPGSINSKTFKRVKYVILVGENGKAPTYTLQELADGFGVQPCPLDTATHRAFLEAQRPTGARLRGHAQLNARRLREFSNIRSMRGGFTDGCRHHAALLFAWLLRRSGLERDAVADQVQRLALECRPPLEASAVRSAVKTAFARRATRVRDQTISDWLAITPHEAGFMEKLPPASQFGRVEQPRIEEHINSAQRRLLIQEIIKSVGGVPSCRSMAQLLAAKGSPISYVQVSKDYRVLGFTREKDNTPVQTSLPINDLGRESAIFPEVG